MTARALEGGAKGNGMTGWDGTEDIHTGVYGSALHHFVYQRIIPILHFLVNHTSCIPLASYCKCCDQNMIRALVWIIHNIRAHPNHTPGFVLKGSFLRGLSTVIWPPMGYTPVGYTLCR